MDINLDFFQGNLCANTRKHIAKQGFSSVDEFARVHEIDKSTLSRMMNGNREPRLSTLLRISRALGVTIDELCGAQLPQPKSKKIAAVRVAPTAKVKKSAAKSKVSVSKAIAKKGSAGKVAAKKGPVARKSRR